MSIAPVVATAAQAADNLGALPSFTEAGITFLALGPDEAGDLRAHAIGLGRGAAQGLAEIAEATRQRVIKSTQIGYGPAVLVPPSHVMHVDQSTAATLGEIQSLVDRADADAFDPNADYAKNTRLLAARFSSADGRTATFYRVADSLQQFRKSILLSLVRSGGQYERLEPADVLLMRAEFEVVTTLGHAFFFLKPTFERAFGFLDELRKASAATFDSVTAGLRIDGFDQLRGACTSQPQMMAKMASIRRSMDEDPAYAAAMTMPKLIRYIERNPSINIAIAGSGGSKRLVFDPSPATRFQIVKLLDDDYLHSILTERDYEAGSKVRA